MGRQAGPAQPPAHLAVVSLLLLARSLLPPLLPTRLPKPRADKAPQVASRSLADQLPLSCPCATPLLLGSLPTTRLGPALAVAAATAPCAAAACG